MPSGEINKNYCILYEREEKRFAFNHKLNYFFKKISWPLA